MSTRSALNGLPLEADLVFDVRFLPNPYYIPELKQQTGLDEPVKNLYSNTQQTLDFVAKTEDLLSFLLPNYLDEGKTDLVIAVGWAAASTGALHCKRTVWSSYPRKATRPRSATVIWAEGEQRDRIYRTNPAL